MEIILCVYIAVCCYIGILSIVVFVQSVIYLIKKAKDWRKDYDHTYSRN